MTGRWGPDKGGALCPSCERYIGPAATCPYCGCDAPSRGRSAALRYAALVLAVLGLAGLYVAARQHEAPVVRIADISPVMNFATVRVAGTVARDPYVSEEDEVVDYLSFLVSDGTGELRVAARSQVARDIHASGGLPAKGARVDVCGVLDVSAGDKIKLRLRSVGGLRVESVPDSPDEAPVGEKSNQPGSS